MFILLLYVYTYIICLVAESYINLHFTFWLNFLIIYTKKLYKKKLVKVLIGALVLSPASKYVIFYKIIDNK